MTAKTSSEQRTVRNSFIAAVAVIAVGGGALALTASGSNASGGSADWVVMPESSAAIATQTILASASGDVADTIVDGNVTLAEYQSAVEDANDCVRAGLSVAGVDAEFIVTTSEDGFSVDTELVMTNLPANAGTAEMKALSSLQDGCESDASALRRAYQVQLRSDPTYVAATALAFLDCARAAGVDAPSSPEGLRQALTATRDETNNSPGTVTHCVERFAGVSSGVGHWVPALHQL